MRNKRASNFNEINVLLHPVEIGPSVRRVCLLSWVLVAQPNRGFTPLHVKGLPVKLLNGDMWLTTEPLLVSMKESKTTPDVIEHGISCVSPFGTLGAGDKSNAVYVWSQ